MLTSLVGEKDEFAAALGPKGKSKEYDPIGILVVTAPLRNSSLRPFCKPFLDVHTEADVRRNVVITRLLKSYGPKSEPFRRAWYREHLRRCLEAAQG